MSASSDSSSGQPGIVVPSVLHRLREQESISDGESSWTLKSTLVDRHPICMSAFDGVRQPHLRRFAAAWVGASRGGRIPVKQDFDPGLIPDLLSHVFLWERMADGTDYRCRLLGESFRAIHGRMPGMTPLRDWLPPTIGSVVAAGFDLVVDLPAVWHTQTTASMVGPLLPEITLPVERLSVPLRHDGTMLVLGMSLYMATVSRSAVFASETGNGIVIPLAEAEPRDGAG